MKILISLFFITGFIFLVSFFIGWIFLFEKNISMQKKSAYAIYLAICMFLYILTSFLIFACGLIFNQINYLFYIIFAFAPFIIGSLSVYKKLKLYTGIQIFTLFAGCIFSFCALFNI